MSEFLEKERKPRLLELALEGDSILREKCRKLTKEEILSAEMQDLIDENSLISYQDYINLSK